ncbi:uncharacterized protein KNAG_0A02820 [Huiozyma naganishii CBS 8797]|uniref:Uncharacterized protein n=1 Tax=Huiozyma naganishii (strain ATCC MYA-139 / BCRC 22969 / CBS 8797 / KCTC 17520 / NBRC 10181 / NCYC 3082 / Yp74L-3) TaxID=1071383 RepID=J7S3H3_HUIN7|nr:hypothetical protein KNAG_0A02820 [Kazachstania naganishii CBS 8797]CCK67971.1 hypothetical protein KNAG_0A02820 [Kazachstania naganishii CBS 8797]
MDGAGQERSLRELLEEVRTLQTAMNKTLTALSTTNTQIRSDIEEFNELYENTTVSRTTR